MALLELKNVTRGYGDLTVLKDLSLLIEEGEFVAIVGYSGAGKSTLISLLAGLILPDSGSITLNGEPITHPSPDRGVVFQNYSLLPWLSVYDNIRLAVDQVFPSFTAQQKRAHIEKYIAMVNLTPATSKLPRELSGGMRQRVSVARALAMRPKVLLMDEPLSALDALTRATLQDEVVNIRDKEKRTVVLITNDVDEGILMADRIIPLSMGPEAQLGPSFAIDLPRPRNRKAMNHDASFIKLRTTVIEWLLGPGRKRKTAAAAPVQKPVVISGTGPEITDLAIGFIPLTDAAPFIVAQEKGLFRKYGLNVTLKRSLSWTQLTDELSDGIVHAAHMLYGIPVAATLGLLGAKKAPMVIPWIASRNGQAITLAASFRGQVGADPAALKPIADAASAEDRPLTFAMTFPHGTHAMWLRYWLGAGGIHPDVDVSLTTLAPPSMVANLHSGCLNGLCVGEPWNAAAVNELAGFTAITSQDIWRDHPEKGCAFTEAFAEQYPRTVKAVLKALNDASIWLDEPANRAAAAHMLSPANYVNCPQETIRGRMTGLYEFGDGRKKDYGDQAMTFSRRNCNYPQLKYVIWYLTQLRRWGMIDTQPDYHSIARRVARFSLYEQAMHEIGHEHQGPDDSPEILFDGHTFDPARPEQYAQSFRVNTLVSERAAEKSPGISR